MNSRPGTQCGFSLLEVLVVLVIMGIGSALMGLGVGAVGPKAASLHQDARRLAQLFPIAQTLARTRGQPIVWDFDEHGYRFIYQPRTLVLPLDFAAYGASAPQELVDNIALRARAWSSQGKVRVHMDPPGSERFDGEWMPAQMTIELSDGQSKAVIQRDGDGRYEVIR